MERLLDKMAFKIQQIAAVALACIEVMTLSTSVYCQGYTVTYRDQCRNETLDLVFLFDFAMTNAPSSGQQQINTKWRVMVNFATEFYESFTVSQDTTHFSLMYYYENSVINTRLNTSRYDLTAAAFINLYIDGPKFADGQLAFALDVAHDIVLIPGQGARGPGVRKVLVIVTDGTDDVSPHESRSTVDYADQLKMVDDVEIFVVTVALNGPDVNLRQVASTPVESHYLEASSAWQLNVTLNKLLVNMHCSGPAAETTSTAVHYQDQCRDEKLDLVVLLDPSISYASSSWDQMNAKWDFMVALTVQLHHAFTISQDVTRFSLLHYTPYASSYALLNDPGYNFSTVIQNIRFRVYRPYGVNGSLAYALNVVHNTILSPGQGSRGPEVRKVLVVITDGTDSNLTLFGNRSVIDLADELENVNGVEIFVVNTADAADAATLRQIASTPVDSHYLVTSALTSVGRTLDALLVNMNCTGRTAVPPTITDGTSTAARTANIIFSSIILVLLSTLYSATY